MTPQERELVTELFDRLATLESAPRDADAERAMAEGLARAPHAVYALVQTALVQDEALKRANARIQELEGGPPPDEAGHLRSAGDVVSGSVRGHHGDAHVGRCSGRSPRACTMSSAATMCWSTTPGPCSSARSSPSSARTAAAWSRPTSSAR